MGEPVTHRNLEFGDVVRARRYGNRTRAAYVIDEVCRDQPVAAMGEAAIAVYAHNEYSGQSGRYMLLHTNDLRVVRSYR